MGRDTSVEGSEFEPGKVDIPGKVTLISAGDSHTAALLEDGRVFIWGTFRVSIFLFFSKFIFKFIFPIFQILTGFSWAYGTQFFGFTKVACTYS